MTLPRLRSDQQEQLTGKELRVLTMRVAASRSTARPMELVEGMVYAVVSTAIAVGLVIGAADVVRGSLEGSPGAPAHGAADALLAPEIVGLLGMLALISAALGAAVRLGPLGISGAGGQWWLSTPADRAGLVRASHRRTVAWWSCAGAAAFVVLEVAAGTYGLVMSAALGAACGALVVAVGGLVQPVHRGSARLAVVADVATALVPVVGAGLVALGLSSGAPPGVPVPVVVALAALAVGLVVAWGRRLELVGGSVLRAGGSATEQVSVALLSLDTRELGRALTGRERARGVRRAVGWTGVRGPVGALLAADAVLLVRRPRALVQVAALGFLVLVAQQLPGLASGIALVAVLVVGALRAAQLGAAGARTAEMVPVLDALLPLAAHVVRRVRIVVPAVCALVCLGLSLALRIAADPAMLVLLVAAAPAFGAAAVRGAYRPPPDWSAPLLATPAGPLPTGGFSLARGPDLAVLGGIPLGIAVVVGSPTWLLVAVQAVVSAVAVVVASHVTGPQGTGAPVEP